MVSDERPAGMPPLVDPGAELRPDEIERYRRQLTLPQIGSVGQRRLRAARVLIIGAGGLGTPALQYLAGAGIGTLGIVDDDVVDLSNLHRQVVHSVSSIGGSKARSAAAAVAAINPEVRCELLELRLDAENVVELIREYDVVLDGADNFATRYLVADASEITGVPVVWGAILRSQGQAAVFWPGRGAHYRDVFPEPPAPGDAPSCTEAGVLGTLPALIGTIMASQVIQLITGTGEPLVGRLLLWDESSSTARTLRTVPDPDRAPATQIELPLSLDPSCVIGAPTAEETVSAQELEGLRERGATLIDIREDWEVAAGTIEGSWHVPIGDILDGGIAALPPGVRGSDTVLYCQGGVRSARALEALRGAWGGYEGRLRHLDGGYQAWEQLAR